MLNALFNNNNITRKQAKIIILCQCVSVALESGDSELLIRLRLQGYALIGLGKSSFNRFPQSWSCFRVLLI